MIKVGTTAWADRVLVETGWYPPHVRSAAAKLAYYASQFPIVENDSTYWSIPDRARVAAWAERTPPGFTMSIKAHALLTRHYASARGLPRDLRETLTPELLARPHLYPKDLGDTMIAELAHRFHDALEPLHAAGRLGVVLFQFPVWFPISASAKAELAQLREQFRPYRVAVELRNKTWMEGATARATLAFFADAELIYTCVDEPQGTVASLPPLAEATSDVALVRMHGRNRERFRKGGAARYRYSAGELAAWVPDVLALAERTREVHVLFSNGLLDNAVANAREMTHQLDRALSDRARTGRARRRARRPAARDRRASRGACRVAGRRRAARTRPGPRR